MLDSVRVAAVSIHSRPGKVTDNLGAIDQWCGKAAAQQAQLILFPELSVCGFLPNHPTGDHALWVRRALVHCRNVAEPLDGRSVTALTRTAKNHGIYISAGLLEDAGNLLFNTQVLVGPEGLVGSWRKMHIPMFEMPLYSGGDAPVVADTPLGRIGANICFDAFLPESTRLLAVQNVEIVLFPFAADPPPRTPEGWSQWAAASLRCRCLENGIFGVAANYVGDIEFVATRQQFPGGGMVLGPRGDTIAQWPEKEARPCMLLADLARDTLLAARAEPEYLFRFRRPELYGPLTR
ncbi:MAG: carbon-nitrogen hydrolase family protein [Pirellulales bacterium]